MRKAEKSDLCPSLFFCLWEDAMEAILEFLKFAWDYINDTNEISVVVRILLAGLAGGLVGMEREFHGRAAGLRTHMLVSIGAALTAVIGVCLADKMLGVGGTSDVQRTGAQVMSGVGFLGAGTILMKKGNSRVTGLTTAAGLWATAAIGLAVGYGLYIPALAAVMVIVFIFTLMTKIEFLMISRRQRLFVYLEVDCVDSIKHLADELIEKFDAREIQVTPARSGISPHVGMETLIKIPPKETVKENFGELQELSHVEFVLRIN